MVCHLMSRKVSESFSLKIRVRQYQNNCNQSQNESFNLLRRLSHCELFEEGPVSDEVSRICSDSNRLSLPHPQSPRVYRVFGHVDAD